MGGKWQTLICQSLNNLHCCIQYATQLEALKKAQGLTVLKSPGGDDGQSAASDSKSIIIKNPDGTETIIVQAQPADTDAVAKEPGKVYVGPENAD